MAFGNGGRRTAIEARFNGAFDQATLDAKARAVDERARALDAEWREVAQGTSADVAEALRRLPDAVEAIARWVRDANGDDFDLLLRAVDVTVRASTERVTITGSIPLVVNHAQERLPPSTAPALGCLAAEARLGETCLTTSP